ncbi:MAG: contractile injection system protein, VgrG/Pvc8 family [Parvibaculaceae bacterium]|nr:contractile injection system protein, VgrG/Pvc8 family [Parvibaculaceae bacterium]
MRTPAFEIIVDGIDITAQVSKRLLDLQLTDKRGFEADTLSLTLDDTDGLLAIPPEGAKVSVKIGWADSPLIDKGTYIVDDITHSGPPDKLTLSANSADFHKSINEQKSRSWTAKTLGDILNTIASDHSVKSALNADLAVKLIEQLDQTDESDGHLLTRLGKRFDAIATLKSGRLLFMPMGLGQSASGKTLPALTLTRQMGDSHSFRSAKGQNDFTGVKANWHDLDAATERTVTVQGDSKTPKLKTLRQTYPTEAEATEAASAEWQRIQRGRHTFTLNFSEGRPELIPETPVVLSGWKSDITGFKWVVGDVKHGLNRSGYLTQLNLQLGKLHN